MTVLSANSASLANHPLGQDTGSSQDFNLNLNNISTTINPDQAWNEGYNNSVGTNPYSGTLGTSYSAGQKQYLADYARTHSGSGSGGGSQVLGAKTTGSGVDTSAINQQVTDLGGNIDRDYEQTMQMLGTAQTGLQSQADVASQQIGNQYNAAKTELGNQQGVAQEGIQSQVQTGEKQGTTAVQQARDLFRQTQQSNVAQLSALGISSSSVAEALAETLGVDTARRIAGITGSVDEIRQNATKELARVNDYYGQKVTELGQTRDTQLSDIQSQLLQGIRQINDSRSQAAVDKANARTTLISNAQQAVANLQLQSQQFQQSLDAWKAQKDSALSGVLDQTQFNNQMQSQYDNLSQTYNPTQYAQYDILRQTTMNANGEWSGGYQVSPKAPQEGQTKDINGTTYMYSQGQWVPAQ